MSKDANGRSGPAAASAGSLAAQESFFEQLGMMRRAFWDSPRRNTLLLLGGTIFAVIAATAFGQLLVNRWYKPFYDAIERRDIDGFLHQLTVFAEIAAVLLVLNVAQTFLDQAIRLKLREGLTLDLIGEWLKPRRAFRIANAGDIGAHPDQRLHEDAHHLSELTTGLGIGLLQASILLVSFVSVLWSLSSGFVFHVGGRAIDIPGYMVWAAFLYAGLAAGLSWLVGRPLIRYNSARYAREAELRFAFMRVNEHIDAISLAAGEADEKRRLELDLDSVLAATWRIVRATVRLEWVTAGYGWITVVAPIIIASPLYFSGTMTFGGLMMAVGAFNQVHNSLRWFVDNISGIADWRATLLRVAAFRAALLKVDTAHGSGHRIAYAESDSERMSFRNLEIASTAGCTRLSQSDVEIGPGERVAMTGQAGAGKTLAFRAIAGLWPWGAGSIRLPRGEAVTFVPRMPYLPPGSLREALAYPREASAFSDGDMVALLGKVGLDRLSGRLDHVARWDRELTEGEQRLLAFARLGLHKPRWVVIDEALDALDGQARKAVLALMEQELAGAAIVNIGEAGRGDRAFPRVLKLVADPKGRPVEKLEAGPRAEPERA